MSNQWYYTKDGKTKIGPISEAELKNLARTGQVQPSDMVRSDSTPKWIPAAQVEGLFGNVPTLPVVPGPATPAVQAAKSGPTESLKGSPPPIPTASTSGNSTLGQSLQVKANELWIKFLALPKNTRLAILGGGAAGIVLMTCLCCGVFGLIGGGGGSGDTGAKGTHQQASKSNVKITEWRDAQKKLWLWSDEPVPILYGYSDRIIARMPADQKALIAGMEKLVSETNEELAQMAGNPVLLGRFQDDLHKKSSHLLPDKASPMRGWIGQISLQPDGVVVTFGWRSQKAINPSSSYLLMAAPQERFITITLDTNDLSNKAVEQFKSLKDDDWVSVDIVSAEWIGTSLLGLVVGDGEKRVCVPGIVTVRDSLRFKRDRPLNEEPVVKKIPEK